MPGMHASNTNMKMILIIRISRKNLLEETPRPSD